MESISWSWVVWGLVVLLAIRGLIRMSKDLRERLQQLLVDYVKEQKQEANRKRKIMEIRDKFRRMKEAANRQAQSELAKEQALKENAQRVKARVAADQADRDTNASEQRRAA
jgi:predicted Holliday junction resolvase-like endonuclease